MVCALPEVHEPTLHAHMDVSVRPLVGVLGVPDLLLLDLLLVDQLLPILVNLGQAI